MEEFDIKDFTVGDKVKAFHPGTLGVVAHGTVTTVGRKWLHVAFNVEGDDARPRKVAPGDVVKRGELVAERYDLDAGKSDAQKYVDSRTPRRYARVAS